MGQEKVDNRVDKRSYILGTRVQEEEVDHQTVEIEIEKK